MFNLRSRLLSALTLASVTFSSACGPAEPTADTDSPAEGLAWREDAALAESLNTTPTAAWWYHGQTPEQVSELVSANDARIISLQVEQASPLRFTVSLVKNTGTYAKGWWWYYGVSSSRLADALAQNGARLLDVKTYTSGGVRKFAAIMVNNSNAATTRIGELMRDGTDGDTGHYVKQVGGAVQASLQGNLVFEPASTIKALIGLHAMREVDAGRASLNQLVNIYAPSSGSCPTSTITGTETLGNAIYNMLEFSDNQRTRAVIDAFGFAPINQTADAAGMTSTQLNHYPACTSACPNRPVTSPASGAR